MVQQRRKTLGPDGFLLGIVVGAALLIVVSIVVVLIARQAPPPAPPDPDSPAGVVSAYVDAMRTGDYERARSYLTVEQRALSQTHSWPTYAPSNDNTTRIIVETTREDVTSADVQITISRYSSRPGPFSTSASHRDLTAHLVREDGAWRISPALEPYAFY